MAKQLLKGNVAIAEAAVRAGCQAYFGYPITPQTELLEHLSHRMPELGRVFLQAESEIAAINMLYGAACTGVRAMTSSSSPGISLMQEGFSYIACSEVPAVVIDVMRGGPGLGNIQPSQSDYNQISKTAGHGDFRPIVLAPNTIQEAIDLTVLAFDLAEKYRTLVVLALDGAIGQMMEPAELPAMRGPKTPEFPWALTGAKGRQKNIITSLHLSADVLGAVNARLQQKLAVVEASEVRYQEIATEDSELVIVAFGTAARVAQTAISELRASGVPAGLFRPITLWPFPQNALSQIANHAKAFLTVEMNAGQMVHDVRLAVGRDAQVDFIGWPGGTIPLSEDITEKACEIWRQIEVVAQHL